MPRFPKLDDDSVAMFDRASPIPMRLGDKVKLFVREVHRQRAVAAAQGLRLVPPPTKAQLVALALWADRKEREGAAGVAGLGEGEQEGATSGAVAGASIGMVAGPWGAAIGAVVGGVAGAFAGRAQAKKQRMTAKKAEKTVKIGLKASEVQSKGMKESAKLILQAEKVKASAAAKLPAWGWAMVVIGGVALLSGTIYYTMKD